MEKKDNILSVNEKIGKIINKYYTPEVFKEVSYSFTPICIIKLEISTPLIDFDSMEKDFKSIGFKVKFHPLTKKGLVSYDLKYEEEFTRYLVSFEAEDFSKMKPKSKKHKTLVIQIILVLITSITIYYSAIFYITFIEPFYGDYGIISVRTITSIISFCIGMFLIIVTHEFGHIYFSKRHKLKVSYPYLIPGPPPLGMLGAFVSIKDDPRTRNQKFDVSIGGIGLGITISCLLVMIGFLFSQQIDTETYIQSTVLFSGDSAIDVASDLSRHLNSYNLIFLGLRYLFFDVSGIITLYGYDLPNQILIIHPLAYSGWIGLLISGLNLIPLSFLDGGHLLRSIFPSRFTKLIGIIIGIIIWLSLNPEFWFIAFLGLPGAIRDLNPQERTSPVPNPTIPLTKSRKIVAILFLGLFVLLWPLSYDRLLFGIGF